MTEPVGCGHDHPDSGAAFSQRDKALIDDFRAHGGVVTEGVHTGRTVLLLTTIGARTGGPRIAPLVYTRDGDRYVIVASKGGAPTHPAWYLNLVAHPIVTVEVGRETFLARAVMTEGAERDRLFAAHAAEFSYFTGYQKKTSRVIPVVLLERTGDATEEAVSRGFDAVKTVTIDAPRETVWEALTDPAKVKEWMHGTTVASDWVVGNPVTWTGEWKGRSYVDKGIVLAVEPGRLLRYTHWSPMGGTEDAPENYHTVTFELAGVRDTTTLTLTQDNNATQEEADAVAENNWGPVLLGLKAVAEKQPSNHG